MTIAKNPLTIFLKKFPVSNALEHFLDGHLVHWIVMVLILANSLILGLETSHDIMVTYGYLLQPVTKGIFWVFIGELVLRIGAAGLRFIKKPLDLLDFLAISATVILGNSGFMVLRLIRVLRIFLLHDFSPRMRHLLHGFGYVFPGVIHVLGLFLILFYIASIIAVAMFNHPDIEAFQTIGHAMKSLFQVLTGDDWYKLMREVEKFYPYAWIFFISFYIIMVFVVLNFFIGIVVRALQVAEEKQGFDQQEKIFEHIRKIQEELHQIRLLIQKD